jgi:hypothetical protein
MLSNELLKILPAFSNTETTLIDDQSVDDIIKAIQSAQKFYAKDYEKIYPYFVGRDPIETAHNIWDFLKENIDYVIEPDSLQTIKSPAAIIATGKRGLGGNDCKNFALFTGGILNAYRDNELKDFELYFRFASYSEYEDTPQHVFVVMVINKKEIWVDAVLDKFNEHREPSYYIDKKIKPMALVALSGMRRLGDDTGGGGYEGGYDYSSDPGYDYSGDTSGDGYSYYDNGDGTYTELDPQGNLTDYNNDGTLVSGNPGDLSYDDSTGSYSDASGSQFWDNGDGTYYELEPNGDLTLYTNEGDIINDDGSISHDNKDGTYTETGVDGDVTIYNNDGTIAAQNPQGGRTSRSGNPAPKAPAAKPASGGGFASTGGGGASGGGTSSGGGGTSSSKPPTTANTPTDPLNAIIKSLSSLLGGKTQKPIVNPKTPAKVSNTGTYLLIGGAALIALILTRKKK